MKNNSNIPNADDFPFAENTALRQINQRLRDDLDNANKTIAMLKTMSLDEFCLWQANITPIKGDQK